MIQITEDTGITSAISSGNMKLIIRSIVIKYLMLSGSQTIIVMLMNSTSLMDYQEMNSIGVNGWISRT